MLKLALFACMAVAIAFGDNCTVPDFSRVDCGYYGIDQTKCIAKGCCWASSTAGGVPWCFYSNGTAPTLPPTPTGTPGAVPFSADEMKTIWGYFLSNIDIQGQGAVAASPSKSNPDYYYHWSRDAAISMRMVLHYGANYTDVNTKMQHYFGFVQTQMNSQSPNGISMHGEPKYFLPNGPVYNGGWARPQNDGAGLRAMVLSEWVKKLMDDGKLRVGDKLLSDVASFIRADLDYVCSVWSANGADLWEEVYSSDFLWTRGVQYYGLVLGSATVLRAGIKSTNNYTEVADRILNTLPNHWNGVYLFESSNRQMDTAVNLLLNHVPVPHDYFNLTGAKVLATLSAYTTTFRNTFPINNADDTRGIPGVLYGRYPGDSYYGGNPWILCSCAVAENYYRIATALLQQGTMPTGDTLVEVKRLLSLSDNALRGTTLRSLAAQVSQKGDDLLQRVRYHVTGNNFHMAEQIDKNSGNQISAADLTWSYGTVIGAMGARAKYSAAMESF